jgi:large subunit ribosomal protein L4
MKLAIKTLDGKESGDVTLNKDVFGLDVEGKEHLMHRAVNYHRAKMRSGNHKVKQRHEISGTGKKPWAQKGTGRARAGDLKRNIDRGGQTVHGPVVRDHSIKMPKKMRNHALKLALSTKAKDKKIIVLADDKAKDHKTKAMAAAFKKMDVSNALIIGGAEIDTNFKRATNNIPNIDVLTTLGANVYDILRRDTLVLTQDAVNDLTERLK